jgi:hypothetical protein
VISEKEKKELEKTRQKYANRANRAYRYAIGSAALFLSISARAFIDLLQLHPTKSLHRGQNRKCDTCKLPPPSNIRARERPKMTQWNAIMSSWGFERFHEELPIHHISESNSGLGRYYLGFELMPSLGSVGGPIGTELPRTQWQATACTVQLAGSRESPNRSFQLLLRRLFYYPAFLPCFRIRFVLHGNLLTASLCTNNGAGTQGQNARFCGE